MVPSVPAGVNVETTFTRPHRPDVPDTHTPEGGDHLNDDATVERLVTDHMWIVERAMRNLVTGLPSHVDRDDLYSAGQIALLAVARRWDPSEEVLFSTYAKNRVRGAMLDALRDSDWAPRSSRRRTTAVQAAEATLRQRLHREPTVAEVAAVTGLRTDQVQAARGLVDRTKVLSLDTPLPGSEQSPSEVVSCPSAGTEAQLEERELRAELAGALAALDERSRAVLVGIYLEHRCLADIGEDFGVTESRISQIHHKALDIVAGLLSDCWDRHHGAPQVEFDTRGLGRSFDRANERYQQWHAAQAGRLLSSF